jgi:integrase/recombinase XerD
MRSKHLPKRLTRDEVARLLAQPSRKYPTGVRNRALLRVLYRCGLRCAEALELRVRDVNLDRCEIRVNAGKGDKDRVVWFDSTTAEILERWKDVRPRSDWLFCTLKGRQLDGRYVRAMVARYGRKAGIELRTHPHMLRHTLASELLEEGASIVEVQKILGHSDVSTTMIYTHVVDESLRRRLMERT